MLKFKVKDSTHQNISVFTKYLCILGFIGSIIFFGYSMFKNYQEASTILSDSVVLDAALSLDDISQERGRKGRTTETYHFSYSYTVNDQEFSKSFTSSESNADKYIDSQTVQIAYAKSNPALSGKVDQLERNSSISSLLWRGAIGIFGLMFIAALIFGLITSVIFVNKGQPEEE